MTVGLTAMTVGLTAPAGVLYPQHGIVRSIAWIA